MRGILAGQSMKKSFVWFFLVTSITIHGICEEILMKV